MMENDLYRCWECKKVYGFSEMCFPADRYFGPHECRYCSHDRYFKNVAITYILNNYNLRSGEYCEELLEIETIRAKIRWAIRGKETRFITYKKENMITQVNNSHELRQALNENLHALLTKKRQLLLAKEVNNTLGKILMDVKMEIMQNALTGERRPISWFDRNITSGISNGQQKKLKTA